MRYMLLSVLLALLAGCGVEGLHNAKPITIIQGGAGGEGSAIIITASLSF